MIARFHKGAHGWSLPAAVLLVVLAVVTLTNAQTRAPATASAPATGIVNDPLLTDEQRSYLESRESSELSLLDESPYADLAPAARARLEAKWLTALNRPNDPLYEQAICGLPMIHSTRAAAPILRIAAERRQKDNRDRWLATRALGLLGERSVVPQLIALTYHYNKETRMFAQISLVRLTGQNFGDDWQAWAKWWNAQDGKPAALTQRIRWPGEEPSDDPGAPAGAQGSRTGGGFGRTTPRSK